MVSLPRLVACPNCHGLGTDPELNRPGSQDWCQLCAGGGMVLLGRKCLCGRPVTTTIALLCPVCKWEAVLEERKQSQQQQSGRADFNMI